MTTEEIKKANEAANTASAISNADRINRINQMYDAQKEANRLALETSYKQNMSDAQAARDKIAPQYQGAANDLAVQYERNRRNYNQQAVNSGINTGAASQARLSQSNEYLRDFGKLRAAESEALTEADRGITNLKTQYQNAITVAAAEADYKKAAALLDEYNNQYSRDMAQAQMLAQYGDFSKYANIYGQSAADNMLAVWKAQNPDLAYNTGRMTAEEYKAMTGQYPAGYQVPSSGGGYYYGSGGGGGGDGETDKFQEYYDMVQTAKKTIGTAASAQKNTIYKQAVAAINEGAATGELSATGKRQLLQALIPNAR